MRSWLMSQGFFIVATSLINEGGAPLLRGIREAFILPDNLAMRDGLSRWIEVKTKTRPTYQRNRRRFEHGIPARHWRHYRDVVAHTGIPGTLAILQLEGHRIGLGELARIGKRLAAYSGQNMPEPMVYFDCRDFEWIDLEGPLGLPAAIPPKVVRSWEEPMLRERQIALL